MSRPRNRWDLGPGDRQVSSPATSPAAPLPAAPPVSASGPLQPTPEDFMTSQPQGFPCLFWKHSNFPPAERKSILDAIRLLPRESIVAQFARGTTGFLPYPAGAAKTEATVLKPWHQNKTSQTPNRHITVQLAWMDERRNLIQTLGRAHLHQNQLETIVRFDNGMMMVRSPGEITWSEHRADPWKYLAHPSGQPAPWRQETGAVTDEDVGVEGYAAAGIRWATPSLPPAPPSLPPRPARPPPWATTPAEPAPAPPPRPFEDLDDVDEETTDLSEFY